MMGDQRPDAPGEAPDLLREVLELARRQGALEGESLEAFATGLRERAERVIAERLERSETGLSALATENQWRKEAMATLSESVRSLEEERAWLRETTEWQKEAMATLSQSVRSLEDENAWQRETMANLEAEARSRQGAIAGLEAERRKASTAHESLLAHHQELMARLAGQLGDIATLSPLRAGEIRRRLRDLADLLRADTR